MANEISTKTFNEVKKIVKHFWKELTNFPMAKE